MPRMKIMTVLGTRPEIIRLSRIIPNLDANCTHILVHTGQNYDVRLGKIFFDELGLRQPDIDLGVRAESMGGQVGQILEMSEEIFRRHHPDRLLILGDTNSGLCALVARRLGITVYHLEAGNRCYDDRVPEEVNRRVIDHSSSVWMPYTERSRENLLREGIPGESIYVTGNPIKEVIEFFQEKIKSSCALSNMGVEPGKYFLVTMHRAENVDFEERLRSLVDALAKLHSEYGYPVICSFHPRTRAKVEKYKVDIERDGMRFVSPLGFCDFVNLEQQAFCLLSDSGTVQEEACIYQVPNVTIRDVTERPETLECGSNVLAGASVESILALVRFVTSRKGTWRPPEEYQVLNVSDVVCRIMLGFRNLDLSAQQWAVR
jgi:UDP-N-acetylglucosamine 2-epimerase (non-hydrolysing)